MISSVHFGSVTLENRSLINTVTGEGTILQEFGCIDYLVSFSILRHVLLILWCCSDLQI